MKEKVSINFKLNQTSGASTSFITDGTYEEFKDFKRLCFLEETEIKALTTVDIYNNDTIFLKRSGSIKMTMEYDLTKETVVKMDTDFNYHLEMLNYTSLIEINDNSLRVIYQTETDKEQNIIHELKIYWSKLN